MHASVSGGPDVSQSGQFGASGDDAAQNNPSFPHYQFPHYPMPPAYGLPTPFANPYAAWGIHPSHPMFPGYGGIDLMSASLQAQSHKDEVIAKLIYDLEKSRIESSKTQKVLASLIKQLRDQGIDVNGSVHGETELQLKTNSPDDANEDEDEYANDFEAASPTSTPNLPKYHSVDGVDTEKANKKHDSNIPNKGIASSGKPIVKHNMEARGFAMDPLLDVFSTSEAVYNEQLEFIRMKVALMNKTHEEARKRFEVGPVPTNTMQKYREELEQRKKLMYRSEYEKLKEKLLELDPDLTPDKAHDLAMKYSYEIPIETQL
jgi:hypothetical protein